MTRSTDRYEHYQASLFNMCSTTSCPLAMLCERKHKQDAEGLESQSFNADPKGKYLTETARCDWYIPREALSEKKVFRSGGARKGMRSNKHVLPHQRKRMTAEELGIKRPDLMVKRHIKMGIDVNKDKPGGEG